MKNKQRIAISISTGWSVRNLICTGIVEKLSLSYKVYLVTDSHNEIGIKQILPKNHDITVTSIHITNEPTLWKITRQLKKKISLEAQESTTEKIWEKYRARPFYKRLGGALINATLRIITPAAAYKLIDKFDMLINSKEATSLIKELSPCLMLNTNASTYFDDALFKASRKLGIKNVFLMLSWDHFSSKIAISEYFDILFVWNAVSKTEILKHLDYSDDRIKVVGAAQFDILSEAPDIGYDQWCQQYGLNQDKQTILFSTMPQGRHDGQHTVIDLLLKEIEFGALSEHNLQLLVKIHPFDDSSVYSQLVTRRHVSFDSNELLPGQNRTEWSPNCQKLIESRNMLYFCCLNINIFSTMTIEAAAVNKPIVHIAFNFPDTKCPIPCSEYYNFQHFSPITKSGASLISYSFDELILNIKKSLLQPDLQNKQRLDLSEKYLGGLLGNSAQTILRELTKAVDSRNFSI